MKFLVSITLILCLSVSYSFLVKPQIFSVTKLANLVKSRAVLSSIVDDIRKEVNLDKIFFEIDHVNYFNYCLYATIIGSFIFSQIQYFNNIEKSEKYMKIEEYKETKRITQRIFFIILFVLFRDVDYAT